MSTVTNAFPLYVTTQWPGPGGLHASRSVVQPGGNLVTDGQSTIDIAKAYDSKDGFSQARWEATLTRPGAAPTPLAALPDAALAPYEFGPHASEGPTPKYVVAAQAFKLPWMPGDSHLTMIAKTVTGQVLYREEFNVTGAYA